MPQNSPKTALRYVEDSIRNYWRKVIVYAVFYYCANVFSLLMAVSPGVIYAILQLFRGSTNDATYNLVALSTVICSSIASFVSSLLSFFVVRTRFVDSKRVYYGLVAEYTLFKSGTGVYADTPKPHLVLFTKFTQQMHIRDPKYYDPNRKVWS